MTTDPIQPEEVRDHLKRYRRPFILAPQMWQNCNLDVELQWQAVRYGENSRDAVPTDKFGIYAFVLVPEITGPPYTAYLLYIGKTQRPFRTRYGEYLLDESDDWAARPIDRALANWHDYIWFHFASIEDSALLKSTEETLINACIPPCNYQFTGTIGHAIGAFVRNPEG